MSKKVKNILSAVFILAVLMSASLTVSAAENELVINSDVKAQKGDKVTYSIYLADCNEDVLGVTMSIFYDDEYLKLDADSITYEKLDGVVQNPNLDGYFKFTWTNVNDVQDFSKKAMLVSADFEVLKEGSTELSYFITDLYSNVEKMETMKSYTLTCDIAVNGEVVSKDKTPIVNEDVSKENKLQGDFINYIDGMGEENTPNKDDHKSIIVEKKYITKNVETQIVDVTNPASGSSISFSTVPLIVIIAIVIVVLAIAAIIIVRRKDNQKES